ncbi:hypothetical protein BAE44_0020634 [Dichanthelium oligosanthes]|uniref:Myb/SANT-like domain-containing protein n=1 Tax=Dichanthelium oligosanthes TaxID=888268 RepID=A0A1E5UZS4_9POAL|nr:hypothetical protein BAE44_0020634 [Dichanthelium oligosanthes]
MDAEGKGDHSELTGPCTWTGAMSSFVLSHLAGIVANGNKTSSGFKKVHFNQCACAVNDMFNTSRTGDQIKNHLNAWQRRYQKINRLRNLSAANFDEENFIITLDAEHYSDYIKDHKNDADFLNKPLEHFGEMATIFGNSMATGKYAKGSSDPLGMEQGGDTEEGEDVRANDGLSTADDNRASSSASRPKKAKTVDNEEDSLICVLKYVGDKLSVAIEKIAAPTPPAAENDVPADLFETLTSVPGFEDTHISAYYAYLVANPHIARAFYKLPFNYKLNWFAMYVSDKFHGC